MKTLTEEAEEYLKQWDWVEDVNGIECFIAGATTSKHIQKEKIKNQIEIIDWVNRMKFSYGYNLNEQQDKLDEKFKSLQQHLKDLEA